MRTATIGEIRQAIGILQMRDQFAMAALTGLLAYSLDGYSGNYHNNSSDVGVARKAYEYADAMMEARDAKR